MNEGGFRLEYKYRLQVLSGIIHNNLEDGCRNGKCIKNGNYKDFYTYDEAVMEAANRGIDARKCRKCRWEQQDK